MGRPSEGESPLGIYLRERGIRQYEFSERLSKIRGYRVYQSQVSGWCTGIKVPSRASRRDIDKASDGNVPTAAWDAWLKRWRRRRQTAAGV